jgi:hypothetical protein
MKISLTEFKQLTQATLESKEVVGRCSVRLDRTVGELADYACVLAVGSYGRLEARPAVSDLEWLLVFDDAHVAPEEAIVLQANVADTLAAEVGRKKLSIGKTFGALCPLSTLRSNIGGIADSNQTLTYRMLALTEGRPLNNGAQYEHMLETLANAYGATHTAGHRLLSLATDIARYWRTLRIDYKHKVDEQGKPWAVRGIKLRGVRRFSYLSSAMHFVACGPRCIQSRGKANQMEVSKVHRFMRTMATSPTQRLAIAWEKMNAPAEPLHDVLRVYDTICGKLANAEIRKSLDNLPDDIRHNDSVYVDLRENVQDLHTKMAKLILATPEPHQTELIEMFLL